MQNTDLNIVLFDGYCNLCNKAVRFIIRRDSRAKFKFSSLQSKTGRLLLEKFNLPADNHTLVYISANTCYVKSEAVLMIMSRLDHGWPIISVFRFIPRLLRDSIYSFIASRRYRLFGKRDSCMLPTADNRARFLE